MRDTPYAAGRSAVRRRQSAGPPGCTVGLPGAFSTRPAVAGGDQPSTTPTDYRLPSIAVAADTRTDTSSGTDRSASDTGTAMQYNLALVSMNSLTFGGCSGDASG